VLNRKVRKAKGGGRAKTGTKSPFLELILGGERLPMEILTLSEVRVKLENYRRRNWYG